MNATAARTANALEILAEVARGEHSTPADLRWAARNVSDKAAAREALREALAAGDLGGDFRWAVRTLDQAGALA